MSNKAVPIRSMTGFARVRKTAPQGEVSVSVKSLNHRGLDLHFHMPTNLDVFENAMRVLVKKMVSRGHVEIRVSVVPSGDMMPLALNRPLLASYVTAFRAAAAEHGLNGTPDLNAAFRLPGVFELEADVELKADFEQVLTAALVETLAALNAFRGREGEELATVIRARNGVIKVLVAEIEEIRTRAIPAFQAKLSERLGELLRGAGVDPQRLAQETAILADRSDIGEEIARLKIHASQLDDLMSQGGEVGKKLDFLLQEMNRETNTILSKTTGIGELGLRITDLALAGKSEIEKIREQALNLE